MTLCPIALATGCKSCPFYKVCPLKGIIGDDKKADKTKNESSDKGSSD